MPVCSRLHLAALLTSVCGALEQEEGGPGRSPAENASLWCRCFSSCFLPTLSAWQQLACSTMAASLMLVGLLLHRGRVCALGCISLQASTCINCCSHLHW